MNSAIPRTRKIRFFYFSFSSCFEGPSSLPHFLPLFSFFPLSSFSFFVSSKNLGNSVISISPRSLRWRGHRLPAFGCGSSGASKIIEGVYCSQVPVWSLFCSHSSPLYRALPGARQSRTWAEGCTEVIRREGGQLCELFARGRSATRCSCFFACIEAVPILL